MKRTTVLAVGLTALLVAGHGLQKVQSSPGGAGDFPSSDRGAKVFGAYCAGCHGMAGRGDGPMAAPLLRDFGVRPTDLSSTGYLSGKKDEALKAAISGGGKAVHRTAYMPAWGQTLSEGQMDDLVAYLRELQTPSADAPPSYAKVGKELELGRVLYSTHCAACHGSEGQGDGPFIQGLKTGEAGVQGVNPPNLAGHRFFRNYTDAQLEDLIDRPIHHSGIQSDRSGWWQRQLSPDEMESLIFYLRTLPLNRSAIKS